MAYTKKEKEDIKFDFESGQYTGQEVAARWKMSPQTLKKFSDAGGWIQNNLDEELKGRIENDAAELVISKGARKLAEIVKEHLEVIGLIDDTYKIMLMMHIQELKESQGLITKLDGEKWTANYKALQIAIDSFDKSFRSKRLAMGLKDTEAPQQIMNFNLTKVENIKGLSDEELDYIIANEGEVESKTIN